MFTTIEKLIKFAVLNLDLESDDVDFVRNKIFADLKITQVELVEVSIEEIYNLSTPDYLLEEITTYAINQGIITKSETDMLTTKIMGYLTLSPSLVNKTFFEIENPQYRLDYLYDLGVKSNYIKQKAIEKNIIWETDNLDTKLTITINLSKPEKDNKEIAKLLLQTTKSNFPKCMLCKENLGYQGRVDYPARQTLRFVPILLNQEKWYLQFSPYAYYYQHCILFNELHTPMKVDNTTPVKLFDFIDSYPHYFIGSNASLPIVGGSILNHEHFQGGLEKLPMMKAKNKNMYISEVYNDVTVYEVDWYARSIRLVSKNRNSIEKLFGDIINSYTEYTDESIDLISYTNNKHNAVSPIAYKVNDDYVLDIIFRNNRVTEQYPDGVFHAHPQYHNIKKEGIGLIEAMGLFILPGRLKDQIKQMTTYLCTDNEDIQDDLSIHKSFIELLVSKYGKNKNEEDAYIFIKNEINLICMNILKNISVFKDDELGNIAFNKFMIQLNLLKTN